MIISRPRFLHIAFLMPAEVPDSSLEHLFNEASDWARYSRACWIVWTCRAVWEWQEYLSAASIVGARRIQFVIVEFNPESVGGVASAWIWDWLRKERSESDLHREYMIALQATKARKERKLWDRPEPPRPPR